MGDILKGKVAIVVGAGAVPGPQDRPPIGNGRAAAIVYAKEGAAVMAVDINGYIRVSQLSESLKRLL